MIRGIIFDLDGVLVDAVEWHFSALNRALHLFGYQLSREEHADHYDGLPSIKKLDLLSDKKNLPRQLHPFILEMKQKYTDEIISTECKPDPQKIQLLEKLKQEGYSLALASNCIRKTVDTVLERMNIAKYFDCTLSREDVGLAKPHPDIFVECMKRLNIAPEECLIFEDSRPGIEAARSSQAHVAVVKHPREMTAAFVRERLFSEESSNRRGALEIVIPMAGEGQRFQAAGYELPKPLIDVHGRPMVDWVIQNVRPKYGPYHFTFLCNEKHLKRYQLAEHLQRVAPGCSVVSVPNTTEGAACTVLLASDEVLPQNELLLANSDQFVEMQMDSFLKNARTQKLDGLILTFPAHETKWSYAKLNAQNRVEAVAEKNPISPHATVGIYYFRNAGAYFEASQEMIRKDIRTNNEFYVCPVYNQLIEQGHQIGIHSIPASLMHGLGTPEDLALFLKNRCSALPSDQPLSLA